jgi:hypothetical protein
VVEGRSGCRPRGGVCNANRDCLAGELCCTNVIVGAMSFNAGTCAVANNGACP